MEREGRGNQRIVLESSWPRSLLHFLAVTFLCFRNAERRSKFLTAEPFLFGDQRNECYSWHLTYLTFHLISCILHFLAGEYLSFLWTSSEVQSVPSRKDSSKDELRND